MNNNKKKVKEKKAKFYNRNKTITKR